MERRKNHRYQLNAPVIFSWDSTTGEEGQGKGITRDVSASGAYITTNNRLLPGILVDLIIMLPPVKGAARGSQLSIEARAVWSDASGFAVVGDIGFRLDLQEAEQHNPGGDESKEKTDKSMLVLFPGTPTSVN